MIAIKLVAVWQLGCIEPQARSIHPWHTAAVFRMKVGLRNFLSTAVWYLKSLYMLIVGLFGEFIIIIPTYSWWCGMVLCFVGHSGCVFLLNCGMMAAHVRVSYACSSKSSRGVGFMTTYTKCYFFICSIVSSQGINHTVAAGKGKFMMSWSRKKYCIS